MAPPTTRLYWESPRAKTALATVTGHVAGGFTLDKTLYHAPLAGYRHKQPCDLGHVLAEGHKLKLTKVAWDRGHLVHRTDGPMPAIGAKAQLHLDAPRRETLARGHAAMHLLVAAALEQRCDLTDEPSVVGGGEARIHIRPREKPETAAPKIVARAQQMADARDDIRAQWLPRDDAARALGRRLDDIMPGEPTLRIVRCGTSALPCDAPLPERSWEIGTLELKLLQRKGDGIRLGVKAAAR